MAINLAAEILNSSSLLLCITALILMCLITVMMTLHFVKKIHPKLPAVEKTAVSWFVLSSFVSFLFLGFVVVSGSGLVKKENSRIIWDLLGFGLENLQFGLILLSCQIITATINAPLCAVVSHLIVRGDHLRHAFQLIACTCQLISMILHCGMILVNLRFKLPKESSFPKMVIIQLVIVCLLACMPDMLLQESTSSISKTYNAIAKMNGTLGKHRAPRTLLKARQRSVSTASISIIKLDLERSISHALLPSPSFSTGDALITPITPTAPITPLPSLPTSEPPKIPFTSTHSISNAVSPSPLSTKKRPKLHITPNRSIFVTTSASPSKIPITQTRSSTKSIFKLFSIPDAAEEPSSPSEKLELRHLAREPLKQQQNNDQGKGLVVDLVKEEENSDDENLGEIAIDKIKIVEGLRKRKTALARV